MNFNLVPHLPRLVEMVAKLFMLERKVSNLFHNFFYFNFLFLLTTKVNKAKCQKSYLLQADGCKLFVLLIFHVQKKSEQS